MSKSGTNTVTQNSAPPAQFLNAYSNVLGQAQNVASQPLQQYGGNLVAGFTPAQTSAFNTIDSSQGIAQPYINQASQSFSAATQPLWSGVQQFSPQAVSQYESPYTQQVVNATQQQFNNQNQQQQSQLAGSQVAQGAYGGDRSAVGAAVLAGQQQSAQAPVIAGLENQGYAQGLQEFNTQQQAQLGANEANSWLNSQAGFGYGNLGQEAQSTALNGASAQLQAGGLQQQLAQEQLNVPYEEFQQQQAYPFQTTGWLSGIAEGTGAASGGSGTSASTSTPSTLSTLAGLGTSGLALYGLNGGFSGASSDPWATAGIADSEWSVRRGGGIPGRREGGIVWHGPQRRAGGGGISVSMQPAGANGATIPILNISPSGNVGLGNGASLASYLSGIASSEGATKPVGGYQPNFNPTAPAASTVAASGASGASGAPMAMAEPEGGGLALSGAGQQLGGPSGAVSVGAPSTPGGGVSGGMPSGSAFHDTVSGPNMGGTVGGMLGGLAGGVAGPLGSIAGGIAGRALGNWAGNQLGLGTNSSTSTTVSDNIDRSIAQDRAQGADGQDGGGGGISGHDGNDVGIGGGSSGDGMGAPGGAGVKRGGTIHRWEGGETGTDTPDPNDILWGPDGSKTLIYNPDVAKQHAALGIADPDTSGTIDPPMPAAAAETPPGATAAHAAHARTHARTATGPGLPDAPASANAASANATPANGPSDPFASSASPGSPSSAGSSGIAASDASGVPPMDYAAIAGQHAKEAASLRQQAPWLGLLGAGLGMLAGKSTNGITNIGQGAMEGLKVYKDQMNQAEEVGDKGLDIGMRARQLSDAADEAKARLKQADAQLAETERFHTGNLANEQARTGLEAQRLAQEREFQMQQLVPADVRIAQWYQNATPEQRAAYANNEAVKRGEMPMYDASSFGGSSAASGASGATAGTQTGDAFLSRYPAPIQQQVKAIDEGRVALPGRMTPQTQQLLGLVTQYDPSFDATDYNKRNRTAVDFSSGGQSGKAVSAIETAMAHLNNLDQQFDALNNGSIPALNSLKNWWEKQTGSPAPNNAMEARDAVSHELRRVFATTGGGGLEELRQWQENFPINGSPAQQKGAIAQAIDLMDGRLQALADRYSTGMGTRHDGIDLLSPDARAAYERLTGREPGAAEVRAPSFQQPGGAARAAGSAAGAGAAGSGQPVLAAPPPLQQRVVGQTYLSPAGPRMWMGTGWKPVTQ